MPAVFALLITAGQLLFNATQYNNPISMTDIQLACITFPSVYAAVYKALHSTPGS